MATLQTRAEVTVRSKLSELRKVCDKKIETHQQKIDSSFETFGNFLQSHRYKAQITAQNQVKLGKLKVELRELEDELVRALAVKTRREAKRIAVMDSLSETRVKVDELQKIVRDQAARKDEYAAILSEQSKTLAESEEKSHEALRNREEIQEAFIWYNRVLGFRIDGGHGVTFTFTNINKICPSEEYSFTVRHANETYTLLDCKPLLSDMEDLVLELNKSNGLFRFVRIMRGKFQAAASGSMSDFIYQDQDCTSISLSAPFSSVSTDSKSKSPLPLREVNRNIKANHGQGSKSPHLFASPRRSPRLLVKKQREG
ncbi:kinetochore protein SPC25 homolog [Beta vulgaris subsp. vulgaris]|uniref:kinetochore protein SPC25 homolog n=1 Tax=Beta vulgaris subsp. vulgaris TaxID=3555 RepID=UPI002036F74C|nr:kinetochore protein SPC25 homolog [Beta vulgaris subsp. vulgaris]